MVLLLVASLAVVKSLESLCIDDLGIVDHASPARACWAMGHLHCISLSIVNLFIPVEEAFVHFYANVRLGVAKCTIDAIHDLGPWDNIIKLDTQNEFLYLCPELRSPHCYGDLRVVQSHNRSESYEYANSLLEVVRLH